MYSWRFSPLRAILSQSRACSSGVSRNAIVLLLFRAEFGQGMSNPPPDLIERVRHLDLLGREKVGVPVSDVHALVADSLGDCERREPHVDEQRHMAVPEVVDADPLHAALGASSLHLVAEEVLGCREYPVMRSEVVPQLQELPHLLVEELRHGYLPDGFRGLRIGDGVDAPEALVGLRDAEFGVVQVEVRRREGQKLAFADPRPVQKLERVERQGLVHDGFRELQVLLLGPEHHLSSLGGAHAGSLRGGAAGEVVVAHSVVEYGAQLVVDGSQIRRGIGFAVLVLVRDQLVLPAHDVDRLDLVHAYLAEERDDLVGDDVLLGYPSVFPDSRFNLGGVHLDEVPEGHVHGPQMARPEVLLP